MGQSRLCSSPLLSSRPESSISISTTGLTCYVTAWCSRVIPLTSWCIWSHKPTLRVPSKEYNPEGEGWFLGLGSGTVTEHLLNIRKVVNSTPYMGAGGGSSIAGSITSQFLQGVSYILTAKLVCNVQDKSIHWLKWTGRRSESKGESTQHTRENNGRRQILWGRQWSLHGNLPPTPTPGLHIPFYLWGYWDSQETIT